MSNPVWYIKIAKIDQNGNDQTNTLQSLTQITLPWTSGSVTSNEIFTISNITQFSDHFLFEIDANPFSTNPNNLISTSTIDNNASTLEYKFSSSLTEVIDSFNPDFARIIEFESIEDNLNFYHKGFIPNFSPSSQISTYRCFTYPQKEITFTISGTLFYDDEIPNISLEFGKFRNGQITGLDNFSFTSSPTPGSQSFYINYSSNNVLPGDTFFIGLLNQSFPSPLDVNFSISPDSYFIISSSEATGPSITSIPEPYMSVNYSTAFNCQPLYGNAIENQTSYKWQQIDYTSGTTIPTNFDLILNNSALKAQVQDSNYSSLRSIIPRYLGSKNTTEFKNKWTDSQWNEGTYGKTPSVEIKKNQIGYAKWVSGWPPEKSNASSIKILHLIDEDGNLTTPGASENFIQNLRNNFQSGEEIKIIPIRETNNGGDFTRKVIKSGKRIEPYLYNQIKYIDRDNVVEFTSSIAFKDIDPSSESITENFTALLDIDGNLGGVGVGTYMIPNKISNVAVGANIDTEVDSSSVEYEITSNLLGTNIQSLTFEHDAIIRNTNVFTSTFYARLVLDRGGDITTLRTRPAGSTYTTFGNGLIQGNNPFFPNPFITNEEPLQLRHTISTSQLQPGDKIRIEYTRGHTNVFPLSENSLFSITQNPPPTPNLIVSGSIPQEKLFFPGGVNDPNAIYINSLSDSGEQFLSLLYPVNPNITQKDIDGSGYNKINLPVDFKVGDEVRFEGDKIFMVNDIELIEIPSLSVTVLRIVLDKEIHGTGIDVNQFSFTRYVDDPTSIIIEGFRPPNTTSDDGPYLIEPDYKTDKLDKNIDEYINEYTDKGLI